MECLGGKVQARHEESAQHWEHNWRENQLKTVFDLFFGFDLFHFFKGVCVLVGSMTRALER